MAMAGSNDSIQSTPLRAVVILTWVVALSALLASGRYEAFIRPDFWPLIASALAVLVMFLFSMFSKGSHSHATSRLSVVAACMVVVLPLIYLPLAGAHTLGDFAFDKRFVHGTDMPVAGATPVEPTKAAPPERTADATPVTSDPGSAAAIVMNKSSLWDERANKAAAAGTKSRAVEDVEISDLVLSPKQYLNKDVVLDGMFKSDARLPKNYYAAYRFMIICCAADAQPSVLFLHSDKPLEYTDGTWVNIHGKFVTEKVGGDEFNVVKVTSIDPTVQPDRPYMYFTPKTASYDVTTSTTPPAAPAPAPAQQPAANDGSGLGGSNDMK
jgi:uncharacterized repeat protein (TIGR03943 family)